MYKQAIILALLCLGSCSCQRVVVAQNMASFGLRPGGLVLTANPLIENADKADLSLAGDWTWHKGPFLLGPTADGTIEVTGPDNTGIYQVTRKGLTPDLNFSTTFVASKLPEKLPDGSGCILLQFDFSRLAQQPFYLHAYVAVRDEWLFVRLVDSLKLTDVAKRENVPAVIGDGFLLTKVSGDPKVLLRLLETHVMEINRDAGVCGLWPVHIAYITHPRLNRSLR